MAHMPEGPDTLPKRLLRDVRPQAAALILDPLSQGSY